MFIFVFIYLFFKSCLNFILCKGKTLVYVQVVHFSRKTRVPSSLLLLFFFVKNDDDASPDI